MANCHSTATQYLHNFIFRVAVNVWNECGRADHNRPVKHTMKEPLFAGKGQVHDFVGNRLECISLGDKLGELGFIKPLLDNGNGGNGKIKDLERKLSNLQASLKRKEMVLRNLGSLLESLDCSTFWI